MRLSKHLCVSACVQATLIHYSFVFETLHGSFSSRVVCSRKRHGAAKKVSIEDVRNDMCDMVQRLTEQVRGLEDKITQLAGKSGSGSSSSSSSVSQDIDVENSRKVIHTQERYTRHSTSLSENYYTYQTNTTL